LRPLSKEEAHPRSLSAQYGYEPFPFHTDGAHLQSPPDFMLLAAKQDDAGESPTHLKRLWEPPPPANDDDMRRGVFRVGAGRRSFYITCQSADGRVRFDPGCMAPIDPRSRRLAAAISTGEPDYSHRWTRSGEILIVDNTRVMHARGRVGIGVVSLRFVHGAPAGFPPGSESTTFVSLSGGNSDNRAACFSLLGA